MKATTRSFASILIPAGLLTLCLAAPPAAFAQSSFPSKPMRIIVPYPPGGSTDLVSRLVAARMGQAVGQAIVVDNRPGANTVIGADAVARSEPDGYTLLFTTPATHTQLMFTVKDLPFDTVRDFTPITAAVTQSSFLLVNAKLPVNTFKEFIDYAKRNPGKLSYGTAGFASNFHLAGEMIKLAAGIDMVHIPYKGGAPVMQAVVAGEIPVAIFSNTSATAALKGGKIRALAVLDPNGRLKDWPDVPNVHEFLAEFDKPGEWLGYFGPARMADPLVRRIHAEIRKALQPADVGAKLDAVGMQVLANSPEDFVKLIDHDKAVTGKLAKILGLKPE